MAYQSFPWQPGDSDSINKLILLHLPCVTGKSVLDVGCNTGFFCGWADFQKASYVKGIDSNQDAVDTARKIFQNCVFSCASWDSLSESKRTFDLVLCLSAIHYAQDQEALIDLLMSKVAPSGMLALEIGIAPGENEELVNVRRSIDTRMFPTWSKINAMLSKYAFKCIGPSVNQAGDPLPRYVFHIYHALPMAILMMGGPYTGKSSFGKLLAQSLKIISGDSLYSRIHSGTLDVSDAMKKSIHKNPDTGVLNCGATIGTVCEAGLLPELAKLVLDEAGGSDFVLDHYVPEAYRSVLQDYIREGGYFVSELSTDRTMFHDWSSKRPEYKAYTDYLIYLDNLWKIDEKAYLEANPDVAKAVAAGQMPSARYHYFHFGWKEGRRIKV